jgi:hypothetical protein
MKACILTSESSGHQLNWGSAFRSGLQKHGWNARIESSFTPSDLLIIWGVRRRDKIERQLISGGRVCILERGYIGDRMKWSSVSFGGKLNGRAHFPAMQNDPTRFVKHFADLVQPWSDRKGPAVIMGQVPGDMSLAGIGGSLDKWYENAAEELRRSGHEVVFRPHPLAGRRTPNQAPKGLRTIYGTLEQSLADASICVTWNSNAGVDSVLAGVPAIAMDEGSMAWSVTSHDFALPPVRPDRTEWASRLAWCQWSLEEIADGIAWDHVKQGIEQ